MRLYRHRWGALLPEDDSGRADLFEILCVTSLALKAPAEKMSHIIDTLAPWLKPDEAHDMIDHIQSTPIFERARTARHLGDNMRLLNAEREALRLWTMLPVDMTDEQLAEQRKAKSRARRTTKRRQCNVRTRAEYLAELKARPRPWEAAGVSRRTWFRRLALGSVAVRKDVALGGDATIVSKAVTHLVPTVRAETQRTGLHERGEVKMLREAAEAGEVGRQKTRSSRGLGTYLVPREPHYLEAALQKWGKNAQKKNSTFSRNKIERGWNDLSEFESFSTDVPWCPLEALPRDLPLVGELAA